MKMNFTWSQNLEELKTTAKHITITKPNNTNTVNLSEIFNPRMNYYICSYGGSGSTMLMNYLRHFGNVFHIHDRYPPQKLCYVGDHNTDSPVYSEWFNKTEIPEDKLDCYRVIYIYRNPIDVIFSRCIKPSGPHVEHLKHIMCDNGGLIGLGDVIQNKTDLYGLEEFYDNYTMPKNRNYTICCVKYESFFQNISEFNRSLGISDILNLYPIQTERKKKLTFIKELTFIYSRLLCKMSLMPFIKYVRPIPISITHFVKEDKQEILNGDDDV